MFTSSGISQHAEQQLKKHVKLKQKKRCDSTELNAEAAMAGQGGDESEGRHRIVEKVSLSHTLPYLTDYRSYLGHFCSANMTKLLSCYNLHPVHTAS